MNVTIVQTELYWENRKKNLEHFGKLISGIKDNTDLIVLPEMFSTGFTMNPSGFAEPWNDLSLNWLKDNARFKNCTITGSISVEENGKYYNRLFWVEANGTFSSYNKRHLFRMAREEQHYTAGENKIITHLKGWKICPLICYDLRFPVWSRNRFDFVSNCWDYDVLVYVANWPEQRNYVWKHLLIARAIENQCYVIGVNRIGLDGNGFSHSGDSVVINPRGEVMSTIKPNEEAVFTISLDKNYLEEFRKSFPVGLDADNFVITK